MNWLTAIFGLLGLYCLAGLTYTYLKPGAADADDALGFWGVLMVLAMIAAFLNEWRARRRRNVADKSSEHGPT